MAARMQAVRLCAAPVSDTERRLADAVHGCSTLDWYQIISLLQSPSGRTISSCLLIHILGRALSDSRAPAETIQFLLSFDADLRHACVHSDALFHHVAERVRTVSMCTFYDVNERELAMHDMDMITRSMLAAGVNPNAQDHHHRTLLMRMLQLPYTLPLVYTLLDNPSIDVTLADRYGRTALHCIAEGEGLSFTTHTQDVLRVVQKLKIAGANTEALTRRGFTPHDVAVTRNAPQLVRDALESHPVLFDRAYPS